MKRDYSTPIIEFEAYSLTNQIAASCSASGKTPIGDVAPIKIDNTMVHCVKEDTTDSKNCSEGAHTWQINLSGTIFADGNKEGGCTYDCYTKEDYVDLLVKALQASGSTISGGPCTKHNGAHFIFKGESNQHTGSLEVADYAKFYES